MKPDLILLLYVALGGAFGSVCRFLLTDQISQWFGRTFPWGTLVVNILGCFLMGLALGVIATMMPKGREFYMLVCVGALGGFTTFSAFSFDAYMLIEKGLAVQAIFYTTASVVISVLAFFAGMWMYKQVFSL